MNGGSPHFFMKIISTMNNENQSVEYKESWRDEYVKWLCGFANAQGGKLYIGVNDKGEVCDRKRSQTV